MFNDKDSHFNLPQKNNSSEEDRLECSHCTVPLPKNFRQKIEWVAGQEIKKRPLCNACSNRDRALLIASLDCMRLYGGMITLHEVTDIYSNIHRAKQMFLDPFAKVRQRYTGRDGLNIRDLQAWVHEGILKISNDSKLSVQYSKFREELLEQEAMGAQESEEAEPDKFPTQTKVDALNNFLSRLRDGGGAATGKYRWQASKNKL